MRLPQLNGKLERALQQDSISLFELELMLSGKPLQISLLRWILKNMPTRSWTICSGTASRRSPTSLRRKTC